VSAGEQFTLIHSTGSAAVGTFTGLAEGASFAAGGATFRITYHGGSGHDVVLTALDSVSTTAATSGDAPAGGSANKSGAAGPAAGSALGLFGLLGLAAAGLAALGVAAFALLRVRRRSTTRDTRYRGARRGTP
jgi:hypothetical protein